MAEGWILCDGGPMVVRLVARRSRASTNGLLDAPVFRIFLADAKNRKQLYGSVLYARHVTALKCVYRYGSARFRLPPILEVVFLGISPDRQQQGLRMGHPVSNDVLSL